MATKKRKEYKARYKECSFMRGHVCPRCSKQTHVYTDFESVHERCHHCGRIWEASGWDTHRIIQKSKECYADSYAYKSHMNRMADSNFNQFYNVTGKL